MLATQNEYIKEAADTIYQLSADEHIRQQCQAREDALYWEWVDQQRMKTLEAEKAAAEQRADEETRRADKEAQRAEAAEAENAELKALVAQLQAEKEAKQTP